MIQNVPHFVMGCTLVRVKGDLSVSKTTIILQHFVHSVFPVGIHHHIVLCASILQQTVPHVTIETTDHPLTVPHALLDPYWIHRLTVLNVHRMAMTLPQTVPHVFPILSEWNITVVEQQRLQKKWCLQK